MIDLVMGILFVITGIIILLNFIVKEKYKKVLTIILTVLAIIFSCILVAIGVNTLIKFFS